MFLCPTAIRQLTRRQSALTTRFSSSCNNNNNKQTKDDNKEKKPYAIKKNISFMPVINIPENELAHNAFFSLHRPLLGLSEFDIKERPFFSSIDNPITDEQRDSNLDLYLSSLQPFDTPLPPGHEESVDLNTYHVQEEDMYVNTHYEDEQMIDSTERLNSQQPSMPVFHMPESEDIVDYLSYIESNMKLNHTRIEGEERSRESRLKKWEILNNARYYYKPRFYLSHNKKHRLRRYHEKWMIYY